MKLAPSCWLAGALLVDNLVIAPLVRVDPTLSNVYWIVARRA